uniref:hypothetical protein n=1 Tax=Frankia tisae TaxID=2950104 RepID=UPI0021C0A950
ADNHPDHPPPGKIAEGDLTETRTAPDTRGPRKAPKALCGERCESSHGTVRRGHESPDMS